jgi:nicotinamide-nucleotide amidase
MKAEIISIGDELLVGQVVNTNATWIAEQLNLHGLEVVRITAIADKREEILHALSDAASRADIILITGGLGPTRDDITKSTLCEYFDSRLVRDEKVYRYLEKMFAARGWPMRDVGARQADVPHNCTALINTNGTAPGMLFEKDGKTFLSMPGVPYEMKGIMTQEFLPRLRAMKNGEYIIHRKLLTQGIGESWLAELIQKWEDSLPANIKLAYLPQPGMVRLRLTGTGKDKARLEMELDDKINDLEILIPEYIIGHGEVSLEEVVGQELKNAGATLSTAESCTGGYIAHLITSIPGSSAYFAGSVVAYSNQVKMDTLSVKEDTLIAHGAVSEQTVTEMALGVKKRFMTDYAIAVSGVAGPDGGTKEKPVGTIWIAVAGNEKVLVDKYNFGTDRQRNIRVSALTALNKLRLMVKQGV